jgi:hypothetical protein
MRFRKTITGITIAMNGCEAEVNHNRSIKRYMEMDTYAT